MADINRHSPTPVILADPSLAGIRITGTCTIATPERFIDSLTSLYPIQARTLSNQSILLAPRAPESATDTRSL